MPTDPTSPSPSASPSSQPSSPLASRPPLILGLDTATFTASAALVDGQGALLAEDTLDTSGRSDDLLSMLDELCRRVGVLPKQLTAVAVGAGPGSFTGLRIGMASAKGIAFAAGCPLWLVSSLAAMAAELDASIGPTDGPADGEAPLLLPVLDARRNEVFAGFYKRAPGQGGLVEAFPEQVLAPAALLAALPGLAGGQLICSGDALEIFPEELAKLAQSWRPVARTPAGLWIARLALRGERHDALRSGRPAYLRPAEAEVMYPNGIPGAIRTLELPDLPAMAPATATAAPATSAPNGSDEKA